MRIISFYTIDTPYEQEAEALVKTLKEFDLEYHIYSVKSKGNWALNCAQKSTVLKQALEDFDDDILYVDADARVLRRPELQDDLPGFCIWNNMRKQVELMSGTIYFPNNSISRNIIDDWIEAQTHKPQEWDQKVLQSVIDPYEYIVLSLEWCYIEKFMQIQDPIILHTQASRRLRHRV